MKKLGLLLCATGALILAASSVRASQFVSLPERDARIIVEVDRDLNKLSEKGARNSQDVVFDNIANTATNNIRLVERYTVLNNAFVLEVNSADIESIKTVPGVKSVTVDSIHWEREINHDSYTVLGDGDTASADESENISATTMFKPENTNDGEGTIVAILDNEFHLRGNNDDPKDIEKREGGRAWNHEVFDALDDSVAVRYTYDSVGAVINGSEKLKAGKRKSGTAAGDEGSFYFNSKVPFYYDYGGESKVYGKRGEMKYDVHSDLSYHGSHVASITAANAPTYKGIAPKAQLALMKVFTDFNSKAGIGEKIGLSDRTGAYDTSILDALEDCIRLKVDGINMSLGSDLDDFDGDSITLKTLTRLAKGDPDNGIPAILTSISAGNSGKTSYASSGAYANWSTDTVETGIMSSYANNASTMTIASGHPTKIFYENAFVCNNRNIAFEDQIVNRKGLDSDYDREFRTKDVFDANGKAQWVYIPGFGTSADYTGKDVNGKIAVVNRGNTAFADKYAVAVDKGAIGLVIINNDPTASYFNFRCSFGDGFKPTMPCALVLYKDKIFFEKTEAGEFVIINKQISDNPNQYTLSEFSTDGATFDLDFKPEITAPGDNIKGAVPEHAMTNLTNAEVEELKYKCYQYLSGTSMSAPNFAGAQALVLSEVTGPIYRAAKEANRALTQEELDKINAYRETVNMRLMSTADPMYDQMFHPEQQTTINETTGEEEGVKSISSPRIQGAGMADLGGAISTDVYLEGLDLKGNPIGKSKIALRNSEDIAKGDIKLQFLAHNESNESRTYDVTMTVMRPAIAKPNDVLSKEYNFRGTIEKIDYFVGMDYYDSSYEKVVTATGTAAYKDAFEVGKDIEYYLTEADYIAQKKTVIKKGYYYNAATEGISWEPLPSYTAQSTKDVEIARITGQTVTIAPGESTVTINPYSLPEAEKNKILEVYEYGCYIEGYVTLTSKQGKANLNMPYMGFYSGTDKDQNASYENAPVTEPFSFEKDPTKIYPSYLVNDIAKQLVGKDKANFESMIVAGHTNSPAEINEDRVLENDTSFDAMTGFYKVGTDPIDGTFVENTSDNIYVGSDATNTLIIQQFILRSCKDNYFTITNKETGEVAYRSALKDMLYGDTADKWALHKSHVAFLSGGYVATRAAAIVPLYDETTGERFASGEYELKFNYQLAYNSNWVSSAYTIHIDSTAPEVTAISQYKLEGVDRVRVYIKDTKLSYGIVGYNRVDLQFDAERKEYYIDEEKAFFDDCINEISEGLDSKRLFIGAVDFARGKVGCIVHFADQRQFLCGYQMVQGEGILTYMDYTVTDNNLSFVNTLTGASVSVKGDLKKATFGAMVDPLPDDPEPTPVDPEPAPAKKGCNGAIASMALVVSVPALMGASLLFFRKRKGGK